MLKNIHLTHFYIDDNLKIALAEYKIASGVKRPLKIAVRDPQWPINHSINCSFSIYASDALDKLGWWLRICAALWLCVCLVYEYLLSNLEHMTNRRCLDLQRLSITVSALCKTMCVRKSGQASLTGNQEITPWMQFLFLFWSISY